MFNATGKARKEYRQKYPPNGNGDPGAIALPAFCNIGRKTFYGKSAITTRQAVDWAVENVVFRDVKAKDAPSAEEWLYLERFRDDPAFLNDVLKKRVTAVSKIEQGNDFHDDGRKILSLIDRLKAESPGAGDNN